MSTHKSPDVPSNSDHNPLPPGLQVHPIQDALVPANRKLSLLATVMLISSFMGVIFLTELSYRAHLRPLRYTAYQMVSVHLEDESPSFEDMGGSGGGLARDEETPNRADLPLTFTALFPVVDRDEPTLETLSPLVPLERPRELPFLPLGAIEPAMTFGSLGVGRGRAGGVGNGSRPGLERRQGKIWINTIQGNEEIQSSVDLIDYKDYISPNYPKKAQAEGIAGDVVIEVTIDTEGNLYRWKVREGHPTLVEATVDVLPRWHFIPFRHNGEKVKATFDVIVRFTLI